MIRVLELSEKLKVDTSELIVACALLEIPATSRISCLTSEHEQKLRNYLQKKL